LHFPILAKIFVEGQMNKRQFLQNTTCLLSGFIANSASAQSQSNANIVGNWYGVIALGSNQLPLRFEFLENGEVVAYSISQGNQPIPTRPKKLTVNDIEIDIPRIRAKYKGKLEGEVIRGFLMQSGREFSLDLSRNIENADARPPEFATFSAAAIENYRSAARTPAIVCAAKSIAHEEIVLALGNRSVGEDIKVEISDKWHLGSISKSFTSILTAIQVERGILSYDSTIAEILGQKIAIPEDKKNINVLQLLSHRSGIARDITILQSLRYLSRKDDIKAQRLDFVKQALAMNLMSAPSESFNYSNNGYVIVGCMLETLTGKSWEELISAEVFNPLGLSSMGFGAPGNENETDQPLGHAKALFSDRLVPMKIGEDIADNPKALGPAGTIHSNASDMLKYLDAILNENPILSRENWEKIKRPPFGGDYALGLIKRPNGIYWHNGSNSKWYAEIMIDSHKNKVGFSAANYGNQATVPENIGKALLSIMSAV